MMRFSYLFKLVLKSVLLLVVVTFVIFSLMQNNANNNNGEFEDAAAIKMKLTGQEIQNGKTFTEQLK